MVLLTAGLGDEMLIFKFKSMGKALNETLSIIYDTLCYDSIINDTKDNRCIKLHWIH